jgi:hypothetical protein
MITFCEIVAEAEVLNAHRKFEKNSQNPFPNEIEKYEYYISDHFSEETYKQKQARIAKTIQDFKERMKCLKNTHSNS